MHARVRAPRQPGYNGFMANFRIAGGKWIVSACTAVAISLVGCTGLLILASLAAPWLLRTHIPSWVVILLFWVGGLAEWVRRKQRTGHRAPRDPQLRIT